MLKLAPGELILIFWVERGALIDRGVLMGHLRLILSLFQVNRNCYKKEKKTETNL